MEHVGYERQVVPEDIGEGAPVNMRRRYATDLFRRFNFRPCPVNEFGVGPWQMIVSGDAGMISRQISTDDLRRQDLGRFPLVLQCAGNRRALMPNPGPGLPWKNNAVALVEARGVRASSVIRQDWIPSGLQFVLVVGADGSGKADDYSRDSFAQWFTVGDFFKYGWFVTELMGKPLDLPHGGPVRLVMLHHYGNSHVKQIAQVVFLREQPTTHFKGTKYMVVDPLTEKRVPVGLMLPCSDPMEFYEGGRQVTGIAYGGEDPVTSVRVRWEGGAWVTALPFVDDTEHGEITASHLRCTGNYWRWIARMPKPPVGDNPRLMSCATTESGLAQPEKYDVVRSGGYLNNTALWWPAADLVAGA